MLRIDCWQSKGEEEIMLTCTGSSEKWSYSGYILKIEQNCRTDGLDMRISEMRDDFKMELSYTKMRVMVQGAGERRKKEFVIQALLANQGGSRQPSLWNQTQLDR